MNRVLTAIIDGPKALKFIDAVSGATLQTFQLDGTLVNGPVVVGELCTVTVEMYNSKREIRVYRMTDGAVINRFAVA